MNTRLSQMNLPRFPLLNDAEMVELLKRVRKGDEKSREKLINCNLRLVFSLVQRFSQRGYEAEDLFQIGTIGLIKAIDKFDLTYQVKFSTYAVPMIMGEIRRFLRDDSPLRVSRSLKENAYRIHKKREALTIQLGREPTLKEISAELDLPWEEIVMSMEAMQAPVSIYDTLYQDDGDPIYLLDQLSSQIDDEKWLEKVALQEILAKLAPRERDILIMRYLEDKTQTEIAQIIGLSQVQISRLEKQALHKLKHYVQ